MFKRVLVANRGEIAVRIARALSELGIESVAIYSDADREALHVRQSDYAYPLHGNRVADTYGNIDKIIEIAKKADVDAIHPGYGLLSEKAEFAKRVTEEGFTFIGPDAETIELMGDKIRARKLMMEIGVPLVKGSDGRIDTFEQAKPIADEVGYPILLKAAAGGGGMGMKVVRSEEELADAIKSTQQTAKALFNDSSIFLEKYIERPRHIEIQIIGDHKGNVVYLGERECSIQRRHQKVVEECPSVVIDKETRKKMGETAVSIAKAVNYNSVGTMEFMYEDGQFYFLEMNTRIQVEHTITEMVTGIDLVKTQIQIAEGKPLKLKQKDIKMRGHAIECRICAEDPMNNFMPSPGKITESIHPGGFGVRLDSGVIQGYEVSGYYDSLISKLITWANTREEAIAKMKTALSLYIVEGPKNTIPLHQAIMDHEDFVEGELTIHFLDEHPEIFEKVKPYAEKQARRLIDLQTKRVIDEEKDKIIDTETKAIIAEEVRHVIEEQVRHFMTERSRQIINEGIKGFIEEEASRLINKEVKRIFDEEMIEYNLNRAEKISSPI